MKQNKFVVISTVYNKEKWIGFNVNSIKQQSYGNFIAAYGYDGSDDNSMLELHRNIGPDKRFTIVINEDRGSQMSNFFYTYNYMKKEELIDPEDIIVEVDADDWLLHPFVFAYLNQVYQDPNIWMSYGQYMEYPSGQLGGHFNMHVVDGSQRDVPFAYSHLKTYKSWLLDKVPQEDLINPETGKYWDITADFAMCMPMVEMSGKDRIFRIEEPIYVYNSGDDSGSESKSRLQEQKRVEQMIRSLKPKQKL
jgi:glycosyltransferase involved in cell wall biosynthesis